MEIVFALLFLLGIMSSGPSERHAPVPAPVSFTEDPAEPVEEQIRKAASDIPWCEPGQGTVYRDLTAPFVTGNPPSVDESPVMPGPLP